MTSAMRCTSSACIIVVFLTLSNNISAQGDSLIGALRAMSQRQKDLGGYDNLYYYNDDSNDVPLLREYMDRYGYTKNDPTEKVNFDFVDEPEIEKRISSAFRERIAEEDKQGRTEDMAREVLSNWENNNLPEYYDEDYLRKLWERYNTDVIEYPSHYRNERANKRMYYPNYGAENIGLRKRGKYVGSIEEPLYNYNQRLSREGEDNEFPDYPRSHYYPRSNDINHHQHHYKRFLVSKRSSNNYQPTEHKRSVKKQTDPRVEKELSSIFRGANQPNLKENKVAAVKPLPTQPFTTKLPAVDLKTNLANAPLNINKTKLSKNYLNKEVFSPVAPVHERPIKTAKKSIDWSDYFGIDKRKKSENDALDKEWLLERYHKAVALTAKKRNADLPLTYFKNHDDTADRSDDKFPYPNQNRLNEENLNEFSTTLRNMDEQIIDDALKYTGSHQGETDPAELQKLKDNIINSLAAAYNFEKMRNALEEYKNSIENEKVKQKQDGKQPSDDYTNEKKRVSVPRKEAVDESRDTGDGDNNIKCTTSEDCHEQNYKMPTDILESHFANMDQCPAIQTACSNVASIVGHYGQVFQGACNIYQMCLLCSSNSWFSPTRHCNVLFLDKAYELCLGKEECQKEAQQSIPFMINVNKSLQTQAAIIERCEVTCPDNYVSK